MPNLPDGGLEHGPNEVENRLTDPTTLTYLIADSYRPPLGYSKEVTSFGEWRERQIQRNTIETLGLLPQAKHRILSLPEFYYVRDAVTERLEQRSSEGTTKNREIINTLLPGIFESVPYQENRTKKRLRRVLEDEKDTVAIVRDDIIPRLAEIARQLPEMQYKNQTERDESEKAFVIAAASFFGIDLSLEEFDDEYQITTLISNVQAEVIATVFKQKEHELTTLFVQNPITEDGVAVALLSSPDVLPQQIATEPDVRTFHALASMLDFINYPQNLQSGETSVREKAEDWLIAEIVNTINAGQQSQNIAWIEDQVEQYHSEHIVPAIETQRTNSIGYQIDTVAYDRGFPVVELDAILNNRIPLGLKIEDISVVVEPLPDLEWFYKRGYVSTANPSQMVLIPRLRRLPTEGLEDGDFSILRIHGQVIKTEEQDEIVQVALHELGHIWLLSLIQNEYVSIALRSSLEDFTTEAGMFLAFYLRKMNEGPENDVFSHGIGSYDEDKLQEMLGTDQGSAYAHEVLAEICKVGGGRGFAILRGQLPAHFFLYQIMYDTSTRVLPPDIQITIDKDGVLLEDIFKNLLFAFLNNPHPVENRHEVDILKRYAELVMQARAKMRPS